MARLRSATVTVLVSGVMRVSCWNGADTAAPRDATLVPPDRRRRDEVVSLRLAGRLRLLGRKAQDRVGLAAEGGKVDLHAVEHRAPVSHDRRHGGGSMEIDAVLARNLRGDRKADELLHLAAQLGLRIELNSLEFSPRARDAGLGKLLEKAR